MSVSSITLFYRSFYGEWLLPPWSCYWSFKAQSAACDRFYAIDSHHGRHTYICFACMVGMATICSHIYSYEFRIGSLVIQHLLIESTNNKTKGKQIFHNGKTKAAEKKLFYNEVERHVYCSELLFTADILSYT